MIDISTSDSNLYITVDDDFKYRERTYTLNDTKKDIHVRMHFPMESPMTFTDIYNQLIAMYEMELAKEVKKNEKVYC